MTGDAIAPAHPAATVVLLRDGPTGCEVLLVQRHERLAFHGGAWVFPGGRIDAEDEARSGSADPLAAARYAAAREAEEEAGVVVDPHALVLISRWVTPEFLPKRFDAWFFAGAAPDAAVRVDGHEIRAHQWLTPRAALAQQARGELELPPPTFVTLAQLGEHASAAATLAALGGGRIETFVPHVAVLPDGACSLYPGDAAYDGGDVNAPGPRHRLWMLGRAWRYERG
jgi:8-oxo-dGTP pyrophosphatase MutT (NUDIX family)